MARLRKLTDKMKYELNEEATCATVYAVRRGGTKLEPAFTCHASALKCIQQHGIRWAIERGLICELHSQPH